VSQYLKLLLQSKFLRNIATVSGGQIGAAVIPIIAAPILGRLYLPADYGSLGTYMSYSTVLASVGTLQFSQAIVVEKWEAKTRVLSRICLISCSLTGLLTIPLGIWLAFTNKGSLWFLVLPVSVFLGSYSTTLAALANRYGLYTKIALVAILPSLVSVATSISFGYLGWGVSGLFIGYLATQVCTFLLCAWMVSRHKSGKKPISPKKILAVVRLHRRFPLFTMPTAFLGSFTMNTPVYALGFKGALTETGLYTRANQLLSMPINLIGGAIAQVFQRRAAVDYRDSGSCWEIYLKSLKLLLAVGLGPTIALAIFAPSIFAWFLGPNWFEAGKVARVLAPMLFLRLLCSPLSTIFYISGAQKEDFWLTLIGSILTVGAISVAVVLQCKPTTVVTVFAICYSLTYLIFIIRSAHHSRGK
jgi:O-antigen/teichoic acid export membrane protein